MKVLLKKENNKLASSWVLGISVLTWICTNVLGTILAAILHGIRHAEDFWLTLTLALVFTLPTILFAIPAIYFLNRIIERKYRVLFAFLFILTLCGTVLIFIAALFGSFSEIGSGLKILAPFIVSAVISFFLIAGRIILKKTEYSEVL